MAPAAHGIEDRDRVEVRPPDLAFERLQRGRHRGVGTGGEERAGIDDERFRAGGFKIAAQRPVLRGNDARRPAVRRHEMAH